MRIPFPSSRPRRARGRCALLLAASIAGPAALGPGAAQGPAETDLAPSTGKAPSFLAVVGGTLWDGTGAPPVPDSAIIIEGDRIRAAGPRRQVRIPPGSVPIDATGLHVIPGLIDMHVHLLEGVEPAEFLRYGVTSVRHLGDTRLEAITRIKKRIEQGEQQGPRVFHCGMFVVSQPPLSPEKYSREALERFLIMRTPADAAEVVARLVRAGADVVKVKMEMSAECLRALCSAAAEAGLPVTFDNGDEVGRFYDALTALDAGAKGVEHLTGILFDDPAAEEAALNKMVAVRAFAVPTLVTLDHVFNQDQVRKRADFARRLVQAGGLVVAGSDAPTQGTRPGLGLHQELSRLVAAGLTNEQSLLAATGWAGRALGYQGFVGTIEPGAYADIVLLRADPLREIGNTSGIVRVLKGGREIISPAL